MRRENVIQVDTVIQTQMLRHKTFHTSEKNDLILACRLCVREDSGGYSPDSNVI